jgi:hypothetical protein
MGWLTSAVEGASGGFWGMNDAEAGPGAGPPPQRIAWFQVEGAGWRAHRPHMPKVGRARIAWLLPSVHAYPS